MIYNVRIFISIFLWTGLIRWMEFLHQNFKILDLELYSPITWFLSLLLVEFVYYWVHRSLHQVNILWAAHAFHHAAEDVNITTTIRDNIIDLIIYDVSGLHLRSQKGHTPTTKNFLN